MATLRRIIAYADIRPGEGKTFAVLFLQCFCTGFATAFYFVFANSNFLKHTAISNLPLGYSLSGVLGLLLVSGYKQISIRKGVIPAYVSCILAYSLLCGLLYVGVSTNQDDPVAALWLAYIAFIFIMPFASMFSLSFSTLYLMVHNLAQSKRLMALVAAGDTVASIFAYLLVPRLLHLFNNDTLVLLPFVCVFILIALLPMLYLKRTHRDKIKGGMRRSRYKRFDLRLFGKDKFYALFAGVTFFSVLAIFLADYSYLISVRYLAVENNIQVAVIIAWVFSLIKAGELVFSFLSRGIISNNGMKFSLLLLPVLLTASALLGVFSHLVFTGISLFLIMFILVSKWNERVIRKGINIPAMKVLYQVASPEDRVKLHTLIDGSLGQIFTILSGLILWGISAVYYDQKDPVSLLHVMTVTGVVGFSLWIWCSFGLFAAYRVRIQKFLLKGRRIFVPATAGGVPDAGSEKDTMPAFAYVNWRELIDRKIDAWQTEDQQYFLSLIAYYNPRISMTDGVEQDGQMRKKMVQLYYNNDSFFSRLLIIWYMKRFVVSEYVPFVREVHEISNLPLSEELVGGLNEIGYKPAAEARFYFTDSCQYCVQEIIWTEAALDDLKTLDNKPLADGLMAQHEQLKRVMFCLLKVLFDKAMIESVEDTLNTQDNETESYMFAQELLENLLDDELKQLVMPVISDQPFAAKRQRYQKVGFVYSIPVNERLKEVLMKSFKLISPHLRQLALEQYYELTGDEQVVDAFSLSRIENLAVAANGMLKKNIDDSLFYKQRLVDDIGDYLYNKPAVVSYFLNGITAEVRKNWAQEQQITEPLTADKHTSFVFINNYRMSVDILGLALLSRLNQTDHLHKQLA